MVTFYPLSSGSSGNSYYLSAGEGQGSLLIDAGISARRIRTELCDAGIDPAGLRGILITHDHADHVAGLRVLAKQLKLPVYATAGTLERLAAMVEPTTRLLPLEEIQEVAGMQVQPFATQHDASDSCGFRITAGSRTIGFVTDLGLVTPTVWEHLRGCHLAVLESNYEDSVLLNCGYPYYLKQRIRSEYGHLSNAEAARTVTELAKCGTSHFVLAHLSRESNTPALARGNAEAALSAAGMQPDRDYRLWIAPRDCPGQMIRFKGDTVNTDHRGGSITAGAPDGLGLVRRPCLIRKYYTENSNNHHLQGKGGSDAAGHRRVPKAPGCLLPVRDHRAGGISLA